MTMRQQTEGQSAAPAPAEDDMTNAQETLTQGGETIQGYTDGGSRPAEAAADESAAPFGAWLACERTRRGVSLEDIAKSTGILEANLRALEDNDQARLPERVFVQGYVRSYAKFLGLDENEAVARYARFLRKDAPKPEDNEDAQDRRGEWLQHFLYGPIPLILALLALLAAIVTCLSVGTDEPPSLGSASHSGSQEISAAVQAPADS